MEALIRANEVEVPDCMKEDKAEQLVNDFYYRLQQQGLDPKLYMQYTNQTEAQIKEQYMSQAEDQVKLLLIMEKIAELEKLKVSDKELDKKISEMAESYKMEADKLKGMINVEEFRKELLTEKTVELVVSEAVAGKPEKKTAAKKTTAKKETAKKETTEKKTAAKKTTAKKSETEKKTTTTKKTTTKKADGEKKTTAKKTTAKKKAEDK